MKKHRRNATNNYSNFFAACSFETFYSIALLCRVTSLLCNPPTYQPPLFKHRRSLLSWPSAHDSSHCSAIIMQATSSVGTPFSLMTPIGTQSMPNRIPSLEHVLTFLAHEPGSTHFTLHVEIGIAWASCFPPAFTSIAEPILTGVGHSHMC